MSNIYRASGKSAHEKSLSLDQYVRKSFVEAVSALARKDNRIVLMTADLGFGVLEAFAREFPSRFFNVGVAEQNMVGLATGLAKEGLIPFVYSMGTFAALRPYEFIRNGPILHQLQVRIVGVGGGYDYGTAGSTHHSLEDVAVMRTQPGINIFSPADSAQTRAIIESTCFLPGPAYYRLSKDEKPDVPGLGGRFDISRAEVIREGRDVCLIATGRITDDALAAAEILMTDGLSVGVSVVSSLNPIPEESLARLLGNFPSVVTIETHHVRGGLGSAVAELIADREMRCRLLRLGVSTVPRAEVGDGPYMNALAGLSKEGIAAAVARFVKKR